MEIEEPKGNLQVMKHVVDEDDTSAPEQIKNMKDELEAKMEELEIGVDMIETLFVRERQSNVDLQEAREELIKGLLYMTSRRSDIGVKRMGEIDVKAFEEACMEKFEGEEAKIKTIELWALCVDKLKNPQWHPLKVVAVDAAHKEVIDENDDFLKYLKAEGGCKVFDAVVTAYKEMNEYNPSGRYVTNELWNFKENRKATLKEGISYILKTLNNLKHRRG